MIFKGDTMKPAKRTYYHICEKCGAYLDPGEICDCGKEERFLFQAKEGGGKWHLPILKSA